MGDMRDAWNVFAKGIVVAILAAAIFAFLLLLANHFVGL